MTTQQKKKHRGGNVLRYEPQSLSLVKSDPAFRVSFEQVGCIRFCEKIQGYNQQLTKEFSLNYNGVQKTVVGVIFPVSEGTIVVATEIPILGERWFKGMPLDSMFYIDFLKPKYRNQKIGATIPREYVLEPYEKLLRVIQRYFTCEGRFDRVYQYHVRLLMHFTGKNPLNLPFYLYRSLGKMEDKVQARVDQLKSSLFHFSLVKLLVVEELRKINRDWDLSCPQPIFPWTPKEIPHCLLKYCLLAAQVKREKVLQRKEKERKLKALLQASQFQKRVGIYCLPMNQKRPRNPEGQPQGQWLEEFLHLQ
jgi:hypothetical protein